MQTIRAPQEISRPVYRAELLFNPEAIDERLTAEKNLTQSDFLDLQGDLVEVGEPLWWDLGKHAAVHGIEPSDEIRDALRSSSFWLVQFTLSIAPVADNRVDWGRFRVGLESSPASAPPSAHSLFPARARRGDEPRRRVGIDRSFCLRVETDSFDSWILEIEVGEVDTVDVTGVGRFTQSPSWDFRDHDIRGCMTTYAVIQKPVQGDLEVEFAFNVRVQTERCAIAATSGEPILGGRIYHLHAPFSQDAVP